MKWFLLAFAMITVGCASDNSSSPAPAAVQTDTVYVHAEFLWPEHIVRDWRIEFQGVHGDLAYNGTGDATLVVESDTGFVLQTWVVDWTPDIQHHFVCLVSPSGIADSVWCEIPNSAACRNLLRVPLTLVIPRH